MQLKRYILLLVITLCISTLAISQKLGFYQFSPLYYPYLNDIMNMSQREDGTMLFTTWHGLLKFDGKNFDKYNISEEIKDEYFSEIKSLKNGFIVNSMNKIIYFNENKYTIIKNIKFHANYIKFAESNHYIFIYSLRRINIISKKDLKLKKIIKLKNNQLAPKIITTNDDAYFLADSMLYFFNHSKTKFRKISNKKFVDMVLSDDILYLISKNKNSLYSYENNIFEKLLVVPFKIKDILSTAIDKKNNIYIATQNNLLIYNLFDRKYIVIDKENGYPNNIEKIFIDKNNALWLKSDFQGLYFLENTNIKNISCESGFYSNMITGIEEDSSNNLYISSLIDGVAIYNNFDFSAKPKIIAKDLDIIDLKFYKSNMYMLNRYGSLYKLNLQTNKIETIHDVSNKYNYCFEVFNNKLYFFEDNILYMYDGEKSEKITDKYHKVNNLLVKNNKLYFCHKDGISGLDKDNNIIDIYKFDDQNKLDLCVSLEYINDQFWLLSNNGLYILKDGYLKNYSNYLNNISSFNDIKVIDSTKLMISSNNGLFIIDYNLFDLGIIKIKKILKYNGLISNETNSYSYHIKDNLLYIGTLGGLNIVDLSKIEFSTNISEVFINQLQLFNTKKVLLYNELDNHTVKLDYADNSFSIHYKSINIQSQEDLKYQYRLVGYNDNWSSFSNDEFQRFTNLKSGEYSFYVRTTINQGLNFSYPQLLKIRIENPYYLNPFFLFSTAILISIIIIVLNHNTIVNKKNIQVAESAKVNEKINKLQQLSLNNSLNSHFIFNSLNSIQMYINSNQDKLANMFLSKFAKLIRMNLDLTKEGNNLCSIDDELERLKQYMDLEKLRVHIKFDYEIIIDKKINTKNSLIPIMFLQPYIENSIWHGISNKEKEDYYGSIKLIFKRDNNNLIITLIDNGIGISKMMEKTKSSPRESHGMKISQERLNLLLNKTKVVITGPKDTIDNASKEINGTEVIFVFYNYY